MTATFEQLVQRFHSLTAREQVELLLQHPKDLAAFQPGLCKNLKVLHRDILKAEEAGEWNEDDLSIAALDARLRATHDLIEVSATENGYKADAEALERLVQVEPEQAAKPKRVRRTKAQMAAARAAAAADPVTEVVVTPPAASSGVVRMMVGGVEVQASVGDAVLLLKGLNSAAA